LCGRGSVTRIAIIAIIDEKEWYASEEQQRPLGKATANCNFSAIADGSFHCALVYDLNSRWIIRSQCQTRKQIVVLKVYGVCVSYIQLTNSVVYSGISPGGSTKS
jgi:hypothetical protein